MGNSCGQKAGKQINGSLGWSTHGETKHQQKAHDKLNQWHGNSPARLPSGGQLRNCPSPLCQSPPLRPGSQCNILWLGLEVNQEAEQCFQPNQGAECHPQWGRWKNNILHRTRKQSTVLNRTRKWSNMKVGVRKVDLFSFRHGTQYQGDVLPP